MHSFYRTQELCKRCKAAAKLQLQLQLQFQFLNTFLEANLNPMLRFFKRVGENATQTASQAAKRSATTLGNDTSNKENVPVAKKLKSLPLSPASPASLCQSSPTRFVMAEARETMESARSTIVLVTQLQRAAKSPTKVKSPKNSPTKSPKKSPTKTPNKTQSEAETHPDESVEEKSIFPPTLLTLGKGELMFSTNASSAAKRKWLALLNQKSREAGRSYCSSDGSSTGWHSCVYVAADSTRARLRARWTDHDGYLSRKRTSEQSDLSTPRSLSHSSSVLSLVSTRLCSLLPLFVYVSVISHLTRI